MLMHFSRNWRFFRCILWKMSRILLQLNVTQINEIASFQTERQWASDGSSVCTFTLEYKQYPLRPGNAY